MDMDMAVVKVYLKAIQQDIPRKRAVEEAKQAIIPTPIPYSAEGKPLHPEGTHALSLSHSQHWLAMAIGPLGQPLGVDIEEKEEQASRLLERFSSSSERKLLEEYQMPAIQLWTAKEAVFKAYSGREVQVISQVEMQSPTLYSIGAIQQEVHSLYVESIGLYLSVATALPFELIEL